MLCHLLDRPKAQMAPQAYHQPPPAIRDLQCWDSMPMPDEVLGSEHVSLGGGVRLFFVWNMNRPCVPTAAEG